MSDPGPTSQQPCATIWLADDSASEREVAQRALEKDFRIRLFPDGESLIEALSQDAPPDAVVLDWLMPGLNGLEACRYLRSNPLTVRMPALLLTSYDRPEDVAEGLEAGANDFVSKPFHPLVLLARLRSLLRSDALRRRAEQAEEVSRALIEGIPDALLTLGAELRIRYVNGAAERMLGAERGELIGRPVHELLPTLDTARIPDVALDTIALPDLQIDGRTFSAVVRPMMMPDGMTMGLSLRDVSMQRQHEARRLDFYSVIAHELRSPLTAVSLRLGLMLRGKGGTPSEEHQRQIKAMNDQLLSLNELIGDFLDIARMDAGQLALKRMPLSLGTLVADIAGEFELLAESAGVSLRCSEAPHGRDHVLADARRMRQVVVNLLSNAIKFTPRGGAVDVTVTAEAETVVTRVKDSGPGIEAAAVPQLFQRFSRTTHAAHSVPGTGLGLMIVREIVESHGGTVGVNTAPGEGSEFWFRLPAAAP